MRLPKSLAVLAALALSASNLAVAQTVATGSLDNFDCVNDTGQEAEGFEIDVEDVSSADLVREFPSNFLNQEYVNRFGVPSLIDGVAADGHKQVSIVWAATWSGTQWLAKFGSYVYATVPSGNGVAYIAKPTATQGDSCWLLGQGSAYATSGCEHFGLSFRPGSVLGPQTYHWLVPDAVNPGHLVKAVWTGGSGPIPPSPSLALVPPVVVGQAPAIQAVAEADRPQPGRQYGDARWAKITTAFVNSPADLDNLQKNLIPLKNAIGVPVETRWALLQQVPLGKQGGRHHVENHNIPKGKVAMITRFEYYAFTGVIDPDHGEAICAPVPVGQDDCQVPKIYLYTNPISGGVSKIREQGRFLGAHMEAVSLQ